jgi:hypothetical protein
MKLGESYNSGNWAGAAKNGGVNFAIIDGSCAAMSFRPEELYGLFAGVQVAAFTMVHTGDKSDLGTPSRAGSFGAYWVSNPSQSVATSWLDALNDDTESDTNRYCTNYSGSTIYGGGKGFNGCGADMAMSLDTNGTNASNSLARSWNNISNDSYDATGAEYVVYEWVCNYDCITYPFDIP